MHVYEDLARPQVLELLPKDAKRLLDVGCSHGGFGASARALGLEVWGIEPAEAPAARAAERLDRVIVGSYPDAVPAGEQFDVVTFNDVLEHIADPWEALRLAKGLLTPGGRVVASLPNVRNWDVLVPLLRGRWTYTDTGILDRTHLRFFTKWEMAELFRASGFRVERLVPIRRHVRSRVGRVVTSTILRWPGDIGVMQYGIVAVAETSRSADRHEGPG